MTEGKKSDCTPPPTNLHTHTLVSVLKENVDVAPGEQRNGTDKQNVSLSYLFNIPFLQVRGVLTP